MRSAIGRSPPTIQLCLRPCALAADPGAHHATNSARAEYVHSASKRRNDLHPPLGPNCRCGDSRSLGKRDQIAWAATGCARLRCRGEIADRRPRAARRSVAQRQILCGLSGAISVAFDATPCTTSGPVPACDRCSEPGTSGATSRRISKAARQSRRFLITPHVFAF